MRYPQRVAPLDGCGETLALPIKHSGFLLAIISLVYRHECTDATMLTLIQLIVLLFWTSISSADAEKLFHNRDHSDVQNSHQAEGITDKYAAEVKNLPFFFTTALSIY